MADQDVPAPPPKGEGLFGKSEAGAPASAWSSGRVPMYGPANPGGARKAVALGVGAAGVAMGCALLIAVLFALALLVVLLA